MDDLSRLIDALRCLPGVGPKSAQRMVFHLLQHQRQRGLNLASCLEKAMKNITHCVRCNNYTSVDLCSICSQAGRDKKTICIVEGPTDVLAIEQSSVYQGGYYVLMGRISPLDGIGPQDIGLDRLNKYVQKTGVNELVLALSPTIEGQTTVHFIKEMFIQQPIKISQLAHGIPSGGELAFLDSNTIGNAMRNREILVNHSSE